MTKEPADPTSSLLFFAVSSLLFGVSLRGRVPGLLHLEVGVDESRVDHACDVVLYTEFASREALAAYAEHPEHLRVRRALGDLRNARHQVDYEA